MIQNELYLAHHGRLGMRWGRRNGPPYPLDYSKLSPEEKEKAKSSAINRGDVKEVNSNRTHFSNKEIEDVIARFNTFAKLSSISAEKVKSGREKAEELSKTLGTIKDVASKGSDAYNTIAKIANSIGGTELPLIGDKSKEKEKEKITKIITETFSDGSLTERSVKKESSNGNQLNRTYKYTNNKNKDDKTFSSELVNKIISDPDSYTDEEIARASKLVENYNKIASFKMKKAKS